MLVNALTNVNFKELYFKTLPQSETKGLHMISILYILLLCPYVVNMVGGTNRNWRIIIWQV